MASPSTLPTQVVVIFNCWGSGIGALVVAGFLLPRTFQNLSSLKHHLGEVREGGRGLCLLDLFACTASPNICRHA